MFATTGKYIAFCEGDDYWIDPRKLQKQTEYLESHSDVGCVYTDFNRLSQETGTFDILYFIQMRDGSLCIVTWLHL